MLHGIKYWLLVVAYFIMAYRAYCHTHYSVMCNKNSLLNQLAACHI